MESEIIFLITYFVKYTCRHINEQVEGSSEDLYCKVLASFHSDEQFLKKYMNLGLT
jgi:hypothetical protein